MDVSNPASPRELVAYDTPGAAYGVALAGGYAYVATGGGGLRILDISNPASPRELASYALPGVAGKVAVSGTLVYVAGWCGGLFILSYRPLVFLPLVLRPR